MVPLTPAWTELRYHAIQSTLWRTKARFVAVAAGRGSGKSEIARRRVVRMLNVQKPWPDPSYFYALPTYAQAKDKHWEKIKALVPRHWISAIRESRMVIETKYGSKLSLIGLDKAYRAEGEQYDGGIVDESADVKNKTFDLTFIPALTHRKGWCWRIGVPKRYGIGAREFHNACINWGMSGDEYASFEWPSTDILPAEEMAKRREGMPERDFNEQFMASWENATGVVYYAYDPNESRCTWTYRPDLPIFVGSDFNVDPMAWVLLQAQGQTLFAFDEIWLKNTNTQRTLDELARRYGTHAGGWRFFGDASSRSRKTSASSTDYMQILNDKRFKGAKLWYPEANPSVVDRHAAVNWALKSASGKRTLFVDGRCLHLINDLKYLSYLEGSREPDLRDPEAGHITDALGYVIHYVKPMRLEGPMAVPQVMTM